MIRKKRITAAASALLWAGSFAAVSLPAVAATAAERGTLVERVRAANDRFKDVAAAVSEGYTPIPCASGVDGGAMGFHYVNAKLLGAESVDIAHPQAVMYQPAADGKMDRIAVEYITGKGPASLEGQLFSFVGAPNRDGLGPFYQLHVWAWKANPRGAFADMNPNVSCAHAGAH